MQDEISVTIKVSAKDMFWFMMNHTYRKISGIISVIFSLGALSLFIYTYGTVEIQYSIILAICAALFTIIDPCLIYMRAVKQVALVPAVKQPIQYTFTKNGFSMNNGNEEAKADYQDLWKIKETKHYFYLYGNRVRANILEKKQMNGKEKQISEWIKQAKKHESPKE